MAFNKRTWKGRQGTGLNKFSIDGATPVTVVNQPDSITEQGDALSAGNLNDLENRIYDAFDDVADDIHGVIEDIEDGTIVAKKAEQDANGNEITTTYETKADASELKSEIDNNSQRIENLEVAVSGSLVQTNTDATMANTKTITNANEILPWAILKRVGARAVSWNQMVPELNSTNWQNLNNTTSSFSDNKVTFTTSQSYGGVRTNLKINALAGHKYIFSFLANKNNTAIVVATNNGNLSCWPGSATQVTQEGSMYRWRKVVSVDTTETNSSIYIWDTRGSAWDEIQVADLIICDLTAMDMASLTANQFRAKFPASYYPYDTGHIYDLNPSGFRIRGINLWDEEWEIGSYSSTGQKVTTQGGRIRSINKIPALPNTSYYALKGVFILCQYDENEDFISFTQLGIDSSSNVGHSFTTEANTHYLAFATYANYGTTYNHDIQICYNSLPTALKTAYHASDHHTVYTPQIADGHYVNENCYDYVENVVEDGVLKGKKHTVVGSITYDGSNDENWFDASGGKFYIQKNDLVKASDYKVKMICGKLEVVTRHGALTNMSTTGYLDGRSVYPNQNWLYVQIDSSSITTVAQLRTWLASNPITIYYELAEEVVTDCDPIPNFPCEDGTTITAITPQTDLVNSIDVPSTIAYMTKISS